MNTPKAPYVIEGMNFYEGRVYILGKESWRLESGINASSPYFVFKDVFSDQQMGLTYTGLSLYVQNKNVRELGETELFPEKAGLIAKAKPACSFHDWSLYFGLNEKFKYCTKCDKKDHNV
jgi:hypothetical protein